MILRICLGFLMFSWLGMTAFAQDEPNGCAGHNAGSGGYEGLVQALDEQPTCEAALKLLRECSWGSNADAGFAPVVVEKCEKSFWDRLQPDEQHVYADKMQQCAYQYSRQQGTIFISTAALCQAEVAAAYAADPEKEASQPLPEASFDCSKAEKPLEKAICTDRNLGRADLILAKNYKTLLSGLHGEQSKALIEDERKWLIAVAEGCRLNADPRRNSKAELACARNAFEIRFTAFERCDAGEGLVDCLAEMSRELTEANADNARASFDCAEPSTALEIAICADAELGQIDIRLANAYRDADALLGSARHKELVASERAWLSYVQSTCPLGAVGGIPPVQGRICVSSAFEVRIDQLRTCPQEDDPVACLGDFRIVAE